MFISINEYYRMRYDLYSPALIALLRVNAPAVALIRVSAFEESVASAVMSILPIFDTSTISPVETSFSCAVFVVGASVPASTTLFTLTID